jgi:hypothetical protein
MKGREIYDLGQTKEMSSGTKTAYKVKVKQVDCNNSYYRIPALKHIELEYKTLPSRHRKGNPLTAVIVIFEHNVVFTASPQIYRFYNCLELKEIAPIQKVSNPNSPQHVFNVFLANDNVDFIFSTLGSQV